MVKYKKIIIITFISALCSFFLFQFLYNFNNKYTYNSLQPVNGILKLEKDDINNYIFLIYDWEFYSDELYTPKDFINGKPDSFMEYVSIGERTSMTNNSAFGKGTYRLNIFLPDENNKYSILLPEIYSSYNLYINDSLELQMGDTDRNKTEIQSRMVTFNASGKTQILLNVFNNSHYYSGMIYPPSFGTPKALNTMRGFNIFIYILIFVSAFICFIVSIYMGFILKLSKLNIFAFLTLALSIYIGQDLLRYFFASSSELIYAVNMIVWYLIYTFIIVIHNKICNINKFINIVSISVSVFICFLFAILSLFSVDISIYGREIISDILELYKWCYAVYLIATALIFFRDSDSFYYPSFFGNTFFAFSLVFDRIYPVFEPIYGGWFTEISIFVIIICLGLIQWKNVADAVIFKLTFDEERRQMKRQIDIHKSHYEELSKNIENTRKSYHDMRHHLRVMQNFLKGENYTALSEYMNAFEKNIYVASPISYCKNITIDALLNYYSQICGRNNIHFDIKFETSSVIPFPDTDITIIFGNLLENAFEACLRQEDSNKFINIRGKCINDNLFISISNSFNRKIKVTNGKFLSSKKQGEGIGIKSINSIVDKYGGVIDFEINDIFEVLVNIAVNG